jgi:DNA-binding HxlR family transcriptional regulator
VLEVIADKWSVIVDLYSLWQQRTLQSAPTPDWWHFPKDANPDATQIGAQWVSGAKVYPVVSPKVEYSLTALGKTLIEPLTAVCSWATIYFPEVEAARISYDKEAET